MTSENNKYIIIILYVPVAQLDRVSDSDSEGRAFESHQAYQTQQSKSEANDKKVVMGSDLCYIDHNHLCGILRKQKSSQKRLLLKRKCLGLHSDERIGD